MNRYNQISIIGNRYRIRRLLYFRALVVEYLKTQKVNPLDRFYYQEGDILALEAQETAESLVVRGRINLILAEVRDYIIWAGINPYNEIKYSPIGMTGPLDLLANIFSFQRICFNRSYFYDIFDILERAIGIYRKDENKALVRTFCPFFWLGRFLDFLTSLPFMLVGKFIGIDHYKLESHLLGKLLKISEKGILLAAAIVAILQSRYSEPARRFLARLFSSVFLK